MLTTPPTLLPAGEMARLQSLRSYDIVESLQESIFDEIVTLLASLFRVSTAYVGLMEADLLSFKAVHGIARQPAQPRANSLCALVVKHGRVVAYHDLAEACPNSLDAAAIQNSLAHKVRFYVGAPLRTPDYQTIGTLCLAGQQPRSFSPAEQLLLEAAAELVSHAIAVRSHCRKGTDDLRWLKIRTQARDEVYALGALVRYLTARYGTSTPVPKEITQPVMRRLRDLHTLLEEHD